MDDSVLEVSSFIWYSSCTKNVDDSISNQGAPYVHLHRPLKRFTNLLTYTLVCRSRLKDSEFKLVELVTVADTRDTVTINNRIFVTKEQILNYWSARRRLISTTSLSREPWTSSLLGVLQLVGWQVSHGWHATMKMVLPFMYREAGGVWPATPSDGVG